MQLPDLNCDMGEGMVYDEYIMPFIHSANIACGFHAGNGDLMARTIDLALEHNVKIGAHPSFRDRENFGRKELRLSSDKIYALVIEQLIRLDLIAKQRGAELHHVKPHGALYNMAARDEVLASVVVTAIRDFSEALTIYGLSGSCLIKVAEKAGMKVANEVFADRSYQDDGSLTPRSLEGALIMNEEEALHQVVQMVRKGTVITISGNEIPIVADTICLHSDNRHAVRFARAIRRRFATEAPGP